MSSRFIPGYAQETEMLKQHYRRIRKLKEQAKINEALNDTLPEGSTEPRESEPTNTLSTGDNSGLPLVGEKQIDTRVHDSGDLSGTGNP